MAADEHIVHIDQQRQRKAEVAHRGHQLHDLLVGMFARVAGIGLNVGKRAITDGPEPLFEHSGKVSSFLACRSLRHVSSSRKNGQTG
ncbi:hypothetical protein SPMU_00010 [Sphingomonas mucosissima]|uniref:Uncharacterized protein n=1 Tax=Sphingomonas mucosissima TaxID=370959 RepID=A0A245ZPK1_9SPHN|nr:hypothetical protein SPMU_00010 [Sphingomonas mucosissima]